MSKRICLVWHICATAFLLLHMTSGQDEALLAFEATEAEESAPSLPPEFTCPVKVRRRRPRDLYIAVSRIFASDQSFYKVLKPTTLSGSWSDWRWEYLRHCSYPVCYRCMLKE